MRVSYNNILDDSVLTATNKSLNKPIENIINYYLEKKFEAIGNNSTITVILDKAYDIDHIAYGYHNIDTMQLKLYDSLNVLITTINPIVEQNETIYYFTDTVEDVKKIEVILTTVAYKLYVGGIFFGKYLEMPALQMGGGYPYNFKGSSIESGSGQVAGNRRRNLRSCNLTFPVVPNSKLAEIKSYIDLGQNVKPHFIDIFPDSHTEFAPVYARIISDILGVNKRTLSGFEWNINVEYREAR